MRKTRMVADQKLCRKTATLFRIACAAPEPENKTEGTAKTRYSASHSSITQMAKNEQERQSRAEQADQERAD